MEDTPPLPAAADAAGGTDAGAADAAVVPTAEPMAPTATVDATAEATAPAAPPQPADLSPAACAAALAERFPALFTPGKPLPIKLRIQADIQARAPGVFNRKSLSLFLHRHTTSTPYIRALVDAATRFDLDGQPAGEIAAEHRDAAVAELERRRQIVMAKRQAERDGQREAQRAAHQAAPGEEGSQRPPRAGRPAAPQRPPRPDTPRPPRTEGRFQRPPRPARPPQQAGAGGHPERTHQRPPRPQAAEATAAPATPLTPEQAADHEARRARAQLLRAFEASTISRANFCVLKRIDEATLDAQLQQARAERGDAPPKR